MESVIEKDRGSRQAWRRVRGGDATLLNAIGEGLATDGAEAEE